MNYVTKIRRKLHQYPEMGFELERTVTLLKDEMDKMGVSYTDKYGKSSLVAVINPEKAKNFTIGIRADADALPIHEANDVEYKSRIEGQMHACGHDAHTAIALAVLKELNDMRSDINCCVKVIFQSAEETYCGASYMVKDGVMDDIDCIVALHCDAGYDAGSIALIEGEQNANSDGFLIEFFGKNTHAASQQSGIDANMMAIRAYTDIEFMIAKEFAATEPIIFNAGKIHGGTAVNIISDYCIMDCTLRTWTDEAAQKAIKRIEQITELTAKMYGGQSKFNFYKHYPILINNPDITQKVRCAAIKALGADKVKIKESRSMGGEDFSYMANCKPACMFRLGVKNEQKGITAGIHKSNFNIDEDALEVGIKVMKQFVLDNMNGF